MKAKILILIILLISLFGLISIRSANHTKEKVVGNAPKSHWLVLHRKSGVEYLYLGVPGDANNSQLVRTFQVKPGVSEKSPTPLPGLLHREYWRIVDKESSVDNPDTAPYFLRLDIPATEEWPYGPVPYEECIDESGNKVQCDWVLPGYFGLHGVGGNDSKLSKSDIGSSGCVRHSDKDITYLYNTLDPKKEEIRYYVLDI